MKKKLPPNDPIVRLEVDNTKRKKRISPELLARSRQKPARESSFVLQPVPPGVLPRNQSRKGSMAMDEQIIAVNAWANQSVYSGAFSNGATFLGYPYLSELAQIPEYRKIVETVAMHMTRKFIKLKSAGEEKDGEDKIEKIKAINDELDRFKVRDVFRKGAEIDGYFGRSHLYIDLGYQTPIEMRMPIGNGRDALSKIKVTQGLLKGFKIIEPVWTYPSNYNSNDPTIGQWYDPQSWFVMSKEMHISRLLKMVGHEVPDLLKPAYCFGGLSLTQMAKPYVDNWLRTRQSVADLVWSFSVSGILTDLETIMTPDGGELFDRAELFNNLRNNRGIMMLNKEQEEFFQVNTPLGTLDKLQAQAQEHMASVSSIPLVFLLGITPSGLNASSEGEIRVFYDFIHAYQMKLFQDPLTRVIDFIQLNKFGEVDPDIVFEFEPLWSMDEKQLADIDKTTAETDDLRINGGVISPLEARKRVANSPDTPYDSLDTTVLPIPPGGDPDDPMDPDNHPELGGPGLDPGKPKPGGPDFASDSAIELNDRSIFEFMTPPKNAAAWVKKQHAQCLTCRMLVPKDAMPTKGKHKKGCDLCVILGSKDPVDGRPNKGSCGEYAPWPTPDATPDTDVIEEHAKKLATGAPGSASKEEVGYVERPVRCENCEYGGKPKCKLYEKLNEEMPEFFSEHREIEPQACCNSQTAPDDDSIAKDEANFNEADHPRGQPGNAGQFGSGGGGSSPVNKVELAKKVTKLVDSKAGISNSYRNSIKEMLEHPDVSPESKIKLKHKLIESYSLKSAQLMKAGDTAKAGLVAKKAAKLAMSMGQSMPAPPKIEAPKIESESPKKDHDFQIDKSVAQPDKFIIKNKDGQVLGNNGEFGSGIPTKKFESSAAANAFAAGLGKKEADKDVPTDAYEKKKYQATKTIESKISGWSSMSDDDKNSLTDLEMLGQNAPYQYNEAKNSTPVEQGQISAGKAAHIFAYTGNSYGQVNSQLRDNQLDEEVWNHAKQLNDALMSLPAYTKKTTRGTTLKASELAKWQPGKVVGDPGFMSTTKKSKPSFDGNVTMEIEGKSGRDVQELSHHPHELEVLFPAGTKFKIVSRSMGTMKSGHTHFVLKEV